MIEKVNPKHPDKVADRIANFEDFTWTYLDGDGDFRSPEVTALRDESDFIITNPPFSLFREFLAWIMEGEKKFAVISNMNAVGNKDTFPLIKENKVWSGTGFNLSLVFQTPYENTLEANRKFVKGKGFNPDDKYIKTPGICWLTNIEHGKRHHPLILMTMEENLRHSKHKEITTDGYLTYDNYDAIEVPYVDAIPSDYEGVMGVPITFLDKYCPEQFEIIGMPDRHNSSGLMTKKYGPEDDPKYNDLNRSGVVKIDGKYIAKYSRILIKKL